MVRNGVKNHPQVNATERGPGPGRYALPSTVGYISHDFSKYCSPAYTFGKKHSDEMMGKILSPGPCYFIDPRITRSGHEGTPKYSMLGKRKDLSLFRVPGPGAYNPEKAHPQGEPYAPEYSLKSRTRYRQFDANPPPNSYTLPSLIGPNVPHKHSGPAYTMRKRCDIEQLPRAPGPGYYNSADFDSYLDKEPEYSMLGRPRPKHINFTPSPNVYKPEKVTINKPKAPSFFLGIKHSEFKVPLILDVSSQE